ncbi:hypothetical protein FBQ81_06535 [Chloroflexi bacterium CFX6]|nr:hypothetical protein [Chloroflexi bacterium CFX6]
MLRNPPNPAREDAQGYYLTNRAKITYLGVSLLALVAFVGLFFYIIPVLCFRIYFLGLGLFGIYFTLKRMSSEHIVISENGIEYHTPWLIVETKWASVEKLSFYWHDGFRYECLLTDNSQTRIRKWVFPERYPPTPFIGMYNKTIFPISCFAENWRASELGQQIKQYAPQLFEEKSV